MTKPPPEFAQLLDRLQSLESQIKGVKAEKTELLADMLDLQEENTRLQEENMTLRVRLSRQNRSTSTANMSVIAPTKETIEKLLKNCSVEDLLGKHSKEKQKKVYRQMMQLIHPDKNRDMGEVAILILEELAKAVNSGYHRMART